MPLLNSTLGYGALTKLFHWLIAFLFFDLPNPVPASRLLASAANWVHVASAMLLLLPLGTHLGLVLGHHFGLKDRLIGRMLPVRSSPTENG
jgi:cytochrome b561